MKVSAKLFVVALLFLGTACAELSGGPGGTPQYSFLFTPAMHVKSLMAEPDVPAASSVFNQQIDYFRQQASSSILGKDDRKEVAASLAAQVTAWQAPLIDEALSRVRSVQWPAPREYWTSIRETLEIADRRFRDASGHQILAEPDFRLATVKELGGESERLNGKIRSGAALAFANYPVLEAESFFKTYPVKLDAPEFLSANEAVWRKSLIDSRRDGIKTFFDRYKNELSPEQKTQIGRYYFEDVLEHEQEGEHPELDDVLDAYNETKEAGLPIDKIEGVKVGLVQVTSPTLLQEGELDFPVAVDVDLPIKAERHDLNEAFEHDYAKVADILVLVDVAVSSSERDISTRDVISSTYQSGTEREPNPEYAVAQAKIGQAQLDVQRTQIGSATQRSSGNAFGDLLVGIINGAAEGVARKKLEEAMEALRVTPVSVEKPIYSDYKYSQSVIRSRKLATVHYYVVDRLSKEYVKGTFDASQTEEFTVLHGVHERDPKRNSISGGMDSEDDVVRFESAPMTVALSSILERLVAPDVVKQALPDEETVRTEIEKDRNTAIAAFRGSQFTAKPKADDDRFGSVVVVFNPEGSLGAGFYVQDDLVLTNYHVVEGAKFLDLKLYDGQETFGKVVASDIRLDLALVSVQTRGKPVQFYRSNTVDLGEQVDVIGHPNGLEFSLSRGIISALREMESVYNVGGRKVKFIQTDAAINGGNSGGPMFLGNQVIGVSNWKLARADIEGLNFAVHYSEVLDFLKRENIVSQPGS